jgi:hypothetical protein
VLRLELDAGVHESVRKGRSFAARALTDSVVGPLSTGWVHVTFATHCSTKRSRRKRPEATVVRPWYEPLVTLATRVYVPIALMRRLANAAPPAPASVEVPPDSEPNPPWQAEPQGDPARGGRDLGAAPIEDPHLDRGSGRLVADARDHVAGLGVLGLGDPASEHCAVHAVLFALPAFSVKSFPVPLKSLACLATTVHSEDACGRHGARSLNVTVTEPPGARDRLRSWIVRPDTAGAGRPRSGAR